MRILFFSEKAGVHERRFLQKLASTAHDIFFLPVNATGSEPLPKGINVLPALVPENHRADEELIVAALRRHLADSTPDIVHAGPITTCAYWAARAGAQNLLAMSWGYDLLRADLNHEQHERNRYALVHATTAACDCQTLAKQILTIAPNLDGKVFVFPWGVELDRFYPGSSTLGLRKAHGWDNHTVVISTRSFERLYGFETMISAALLARQGTCNLRFVFAGDGSLRPWAEKQIKAAGAEAEFAFLGWLSEDQVAAALRDASVYMSGSTVDGTSISLLQAFATRLPVVVSDLPANREWPRLCERPGPGHELQCPPYRGRLEGGLPRV